MRQPAPVIHADVAPIVPETLDTSPTRMARRSKPGIRRLASLAAVVVATVLAMGGAAGAPTVSVPAFYPEGPLVDGDRLLWVEMTMDRVRVLAQGRVRTAWHDGGCGPTSIKKTADGSYWVLCHLAHKLVRMSNTFFKELEVSADANGNPIAWPNDAVADATGRLFVTDSGLFSLSAEPAGWVLVVAHDGSARRIAGPIRYANGIAWDGPRRTLYVSEHLNRKILQFVLDADYNLLRQAVFFDFERAGVERPEYALAGPDGLVLRDNGELLAAEYGAGRILRIAANGALLAMIPVPMPYVTNMVQSPFDPRELIVTGASADASVLEVGRVLSVRYRD
jgi:sugar lactone lactonase YvrE